MTDELIDRVRAVDPLPEGRGAPPFDSVYAAFAASPVHLRRRRRPRPLALLLPVMSGGVAIAVVIAALTLVHGAHDRAAAGHHAAGHHAASTAPPSTIVRSVPGAEPIPQGGMSGFVSVWGAAISSSGDGVISVQQCRRCLPNGNQTRHTSYAEYLFSTRDGGRRWTRRRTDYYVFQPVLAAQGGWGTQAMLLTRAQAGHAAAYQPGVTESRYAITADGGRIWARAAGDPTAVAPESKVSVVDGEAWAARSVNTPVVVMHSSLHGQGLTATAAQPAMPNAYNPEVQGAGAGIAYAINANVPRQAYSTHDDGHDWQRITAPPCTGRSASADLDAASGQTVWITCSSANHAPQLIRSVDGGRSWRRLPATWGDASQLTAVNAQVAWAFDGDHELIRTTDAGSTWQRIWSATDPRVSPLSRPITALKPFPIPILSVQSATSASIVTLLNRDTRRRATGLTNLVVYRTADGGRTWQTYPVALSR